MKPGHFEQFISRRRAAIAAAGNPVGTEFNPFCGIAIRDLRFVAETLECGTLHVQTVDGLCHRLSGFPGSHAIRLSTLATDQQAVYLRDAWLNYLARRCAH